MNAFFFALPPLDVWTLLRVACMAALVGSIIFAHGCHPHEDKELFTAWWSAPK